MDLSGTTVCGRFELLREESPNSGVPLFGPTWAVLDTETGEPARASVLDAALLPTPADRAAFVAAISALADLRDAAFVPQVFVGADGERVIVCYDPLQGAFALRDMYDGTGSVDLRHESGRLARQLARALALLHARDRVHGALACEAIFAGPRGPAVFQQGFAPLCARAEIERRCRAQEFAGLAPEVLRGGPFTPASDVYAWGVALAQFVTGARGAAALTAAEPASLPTGLWSLIQASLSPEPGGRPQGGADLVRRIEGLVLGADSLELPVVSVMAAMAAVSEARSEEPAELTPPPVEAAASEAAPVEMKPAEPKPEPRGVPTGMPLPKANLEDLLLTSNPRRPTTVPPGSLSASEVDARLPGRSASGMRRVHVLTEDAIVRRPAGPEGTATAAPGDGTSPPPGERSGPVAAAEPASPAMEATPALSARTSQERPPEPPHTPASSPTLQDGARDGGGGLLWFAIAAIVVLALAWLLG